MTVLLNFARLRLAARPSALRLRLAARPSALRLRLAARPSGLRGGVLLLVGTLGCVTPLEQGERRYREGDRLGALEVWREVPGDHAQHDAVQARIANVEEEFEQLVVRYKKRGLYYEDKGRLAESVLNYRLALKLQPEPANLEHVQQLVRTLDTEKRASHERFDQAVSAGELGVARAELENMRGLDPFDPELETEERELERALRTAIEQLMARGRRGFTSGDHARAAEAFRNVVELDPENEAAQGYLAHIRLIQIEERRSGTRAPAFEPPQVHASEGEIRAEGLYRIALAAEAAGDPYAAIRHDLQALRLDPGHEGARRHLRVLRRSLATEVPHLIDRGRAHYQQEDLQSALDQWRLALLVDPGNAEAREYVSRAERMLQNLEQLRSEPDVQVGARGTRPGR